MAAREGCEAGCSFRPCVKGGFEVRWNLNGRRRIVSGSPSSVSFGRVNLRLSRGLHAAGGKERLHFFDVALGPQAARPPWGEALTKEEVIYGFDLSIYPAVTKRIIDRLGVSD